MRLALEHLVWLGHARIALIKGQAFSSDTDSRWNAMLRAARELNTLIDPALTVQLEGDEASLELGYAVTRQLLSRGRRFTALFAFNDISAIGAMRAIRERGLRIPDDVSVVGFADAKKPFRAKQITVESELVIRGSTSAPVPVSARVR